MPHETTRLPCELSTEKVSTSPLINSEPPCSSPIHMVKSRSKERVPQNKVKPWISPLPKPRISPPKTLGDAVIKNSHIRLRGGQRVPMLFKMKLPSMTKESISSRAPKDTRIEWPVLSQIQSAKNKAVIPTSLEQDLSLANSPGIQTQNSNIKMGHELSMH
jgi:hypothetical protein